jgi:hypothetical protein
MMATPGRVGRQCPWRLGQLIKEMNMNRIVLLAAVLIAAGGLNRAWAVTIGNPIPGLKQGAMDAGAQLSDHHQDVFFDYGLSDAGAIQASLGIIGYGGGRTDYSPSGTEVGVGYRYDLGPQFKINLYDTRVGLFGYYRMGSASKSGVTLNTSELALGVGAMIQAADQLQTYANLAFAQFVSSVDVPALYTPVGTIPGGTVKDTRSRFGVSVGADYALAPQFSAGAALAAGFDDDENLAIFLRLRF